MGAGDELMALGEAQQIHGVTGARVQIVDAEGRPRWHPVWEHHPAVARAGEPHRTRLVNAPGVRPYIKAWATADGAPMAVYSGWEAERILGTMVLTPAEAALGRELQAKLGAYVVVEPAVKGTSSPNKDWGAARFQEVIKKLPHVTFVQMGPAPEAAPRLEGATFVRTTTFRDACGVLSSAAAYLGPEGGLHHAAAVLRRPAVVIFGSFISPETTGYSIHVNFYVHDQHAPCGRWAPCKACEQALERIRPAEVARALQEVLKRHDCHAGGRAHAR